MKTDRKRQTEPSVRPDALSAGNNGAEQLARPVAAASAIRAEDILANLAESIIALDPEWRIVYVNAATLPMTGKPAGELPGATCWEEWPDLVGTPVEQAYRKAMEQRIRVQLDFYLQARENWFEICAFPCSAGIAVSWRDISDRKRVEAEAQQHEKELTDFVENAAIGLHWVGFDGTILWANDAELNLLGYTREEYVGRNIREFHVDAAVIDDILERLRRRQELSSYEARLRAKDGSVRYVAITANVYWRDGQFIHTRCLTRDITEEKRGSEVQQRLAAIVESSDDAIISKDLNGIIRSWNRGAERMFGYTAEETLGRPVSMLAIPERMDEMPNILDRIRGGELVHHYETRRRTKDGRTLAISLSVSPIRDAFGTIIGASKIARDITERVRNEEALRETNAALTRANADLEQFAYSASHDLQEPLRMISAYSSMLKRRFGGQLGDVGDEYIRYTVDGVQRMQQLIEDLLAYTHASTFSEEPAEDVDAGEALRTALGRLQDAIATSGASITSTELPRVRMHHFQLEQVLQNLISNAIRYRSEEPPRIHITADREGALWRFSVRDNGIGIDPKYKERIFGMFKRLHSFAEYPGTGMGLAICQRILHRAGGNIWVESELGRGSIFFFTAPAGRGG